MSNYYLSWIFFGVALFSGTCSTLLSKTLYGIESQGKEGEVKHFQKPFMQTFMIFLAMVLALPIHRVYLLSQGFCFTRECLLFKKKYLIFALPAMLDVVSTSFSMVGLMYVTVSLHQLVRCTVIIYVALLKHFFLRYHLNSYMWMGVFFNAIAIAMISASAFNDPRNGNEVTFGIGILLLGCLVMSFQIIFEEKVISDDDETPPLVAMGMEGLSGTFILIFIIFPIVYYLPGNDNGHLEDFYDSITMIQNSTILQILCLLYIVTITLFNVSTIYVTFLMNSVWRSILAHFLIVVVWTADVCLFYFVTHQQFGESWISWSCLQLFGMFSLFIGTAIYNATIRLSCFQYNEFEIPKQISMIPAGNRIFNNPCFNKKQSDAGRLERTLSPIKTKYGSITSNQSTGRQSFDI